MPRAKVVVIGAGLSGLSAARQLQLADMDVDVVVLEARSRIGGRMCREGVRIGDKTAVVDLGGQWVGRTQTAIIGLANDLGLTKFEQNTAGDVILRYDGQVYRDDKSPPAPNDKDRIAAQELSQELATAAAGISLDEPWNSPGAQDSDKRTLGQWIESNAHSAYAGFYVYQEATFNQSGGSPYEVSLLHALFERKANPPSEDPDKYLLIGGAGQIPQAMVSLYGIECRTRSRVVAISKAGDTVSVTTSDGKVEQADAAMPPFLTAAIHLDPPPPAQRLQFASRMAMGTIVKVAFVYERPWWRDEKPGEMKLSGTAISDTGTVRITTDSGLLEPGTPGILTGFIQGDQLIKWSQLSPSERQDRVKQDLIRYFGPDAGSLHKYVETLWPQEQCTGGAYNGYLPPEGWTSYGAAIREPHAQRIFWAGTETATKWMGYFDGAITAGRRAADEALKILG
ncbi:MAG TPA: FAD-dependent oxidoreductase [Streptosporangiaceae bacterium]